MQPVKINIVDEKMKIMCLGSIGEESMAVSNKFDGIVINIQSIYLRTKGQLSKIKR